MKERKNLKNKSDDIVRVLDAIFSQIDVDAEKCKTLSTAAFPSN